MAIAEILTFGAVYAGVGGCLNNVVANLISEPLSRISGRQIARYAAQWSLPENEHVAKALRTAQFSALSRFLTDFENWIARSQAHALDEAGEAFVAKAIEFSKKGYAGAERVPDAPAKALVERFEATLDKVLAGKVGIEEKGRSLVLEAENMVLDELCRGLGMANRDGVPEAFTLAFRGRFEMLEGWHARFVHYWQDAIKHNEEFRSIFTAERLARIAEGIEELKEGQTRILDGMGGMETRLLAAISAKSGVDPTHLKPLFDAVQQDVPAAQFESAIRAAVDALLAKAGDKAQLMNDPAAVVAAIDAARVRLKQLDIAGAVQVLDNAIEEQESLLHSARHGAVRLLTEKADTLSKAYRWDDALATLKRAAELDPDEASHWFRSGQIHQHQGRLDAALSDFRAGSQAAAKAGKERDEAAGRCLAGDVLVSQGKLEEALGEYEKYRDVSHRLASGDASNSQWQHDLSVSHSKVGDVRVRQGDLAGALSSYEADLAIAQKLASGDASNSQWQRDLSVSHNKIGDVRVRQGDPAGALSSYEADLAIAQKLASGDPSNSEWQRDLSVSHNKIGDVRAAQGDLEGALKAFEDSLAIRVRLAASDKSNSAWQRDLIVSHVRLSEASGDPVKHLEQALAIASRLKEDGRLAPVDAFIPGMLEEMLKAARGG